MTFHRDILGLSNFYAYLCIINHYKQRKVTKR